MTDHEFIIELQSRNRSRWESAWGCFIEELSPEIIRAAHHWGASPSDASGICSMVVHVAMEQIDSITTNNLGAWVRGITRRVTLKTHRSVRREEQKIKRYAAYLDGVRSETEWCRDMHETIDVAELFVVVEHQSIGWEVFSGCNGGGETVASLARIHGHTWRWVAALLGVVKKYVQSEFDDFAAESAAYRQARINEIRSRADRN